MSKHVQFTEKIKKPDKNGKVIIGYKCPECGNTIDLLRDDLKDKISPNDRVFCKMCDYGEYTSMTPIYYKL